MMDPILSMIGICRKAGRPGIPWSACRCENQSGCPSGILMLPGEGHNFLEWNGEKIGNI